MRSPEAGLLHHPTRPDPSPPDLHAGALPLTSARLIATWFTVHGKCNDHINSANGPWINFEKRAMVEHASSGGRTARGGPDRRFVRRSGPSSFGAHPSGSPGRRGIDPMVFRTLPPTPSRAAARRAGQRRSMGRLGPYVAVLVLLGLGLGQQAQASTGELATKHVMFKRGSGQSQSSPPPSGVRAGKGGNGITYHSGPIILGTTNAYIIWYGNWTGNTAQAILPDFLKSVGGSPYFNINTTYYNGATVPVTNAVTYAGATTTNATANLSDAGVQAVVASAIAPNGALPNDPNGVYFVLTSAGITETSGFLTQYCGWHTHGTIAGSDIKYSFVGDPTGPNQSACEAQATSPNGNPGADAMVSVTAHELEESVTDPDLNAWYDNRGYKNADKCAWTFGTTYPVAGSLANMKLGSRDFLIQRNWVNASGGSCATRY